MTNEFLENENKLIKKQLEAALKDNAILREIADQWRNDKQSWKEQRDRLCLEIKELTGGAVSY